MSRKTVRYIIAPILFVVSTSSLALSSEFIDASSAQESTQRTQSTASVPKSSPEMDKLAFLIGTWSAADIYEKSPINPNGGQGSGLYKTISGPGGFSLLTDYQYTGPHGESIGHQILTWDPKAAAYIGYLVSSAGPGCTIVIGKFEGPNFVLTGEFDARGRKIAVRLIYSDITDRSMTFKQYNSVDRGPFALFGTTVFTRK